MGKRIILFCFLTLNTGLIIQAQSDFSFGLNSSVLNSFRLITDSRSEAIKESRDAIEKPLPGYDLEGVVYYNIHEQLFLETGLGYSRTGYATKEEMLIDPGFSPVTASYVSELHKYKFGNIYVPAHVVLFTTGKLNYSLSFGTSFLFPVTRKSEWILRKQFGSSAGEMKSFTRISNVKNINLTIDLGLGIGYRFSDRFNLMLQPRMTYYLLGYENNMMKDHIFSYGLSLNLVSHL